MKNALLLPFLLLILILGACTNNKFKQPELKQWDDIEVITFKKDKTSLESEFHFYNPNPYSIMLTNLDFDVWVNNKDVGSFIDKGIREVKAESSVSIPIKMSFNTMEAFDNLSIGVLKIKSDHVAPVRFIGKLKIESMDQEKDEEYDVTQQVLFTNSKKITLDDNGIIIPKP